MTFHPEDIGYKELLKLLAGRLIEGRPDFTGQITVEFNYHHGTAGRTYLSQKEVVAL